MTHTNIIDAIELNLTSYRREIEALDAEICAAKPARRVQLIQDRWQTYLDFGFGNIVNAMLTFCLDLQCKTGWTRHQTRTYVWLATETDPDLFELHPDESLAGLMSLAILPVTMLRRVLDRRWSPIWVRCTPVVDRFLARKSHRSVPTFEHELRIRINRAGGYTSVFDGAFAVLAHDDTFAVRTILVRESLGIAQIKIFAPSVTGWFDEIADDSCDIHVRSTEILRDSTEDNGGNV